MTMPAEGSRYVYNGNGATVAFSFPRLFLKNSELKVYLVSTLTGVATLQTITVHYTVTGRGDPSGGTVTFVTAPTSAQQVILYRDTSSVQSLDVDNVTLFPPASIEESFDRLSAITTELKDKLNRTLRLDDTDPQTGSLPAISNKATRAGMIQGYDINGNPTVYSKYNIGITGSDYGSRSEFVSAVAGGLARRDGTVIGAGGMFYAASAGATAISDLPGWVPAGDVYPDHWGAVGNAVNDDTAAIQAAANYSNVVHLGPLNYLITSAITLRMRSSVIGKGDVTRIFVGTAAPALATDPVGFYAADAGSSVDAYCDIRFSNFQMIRQTTATGGTAIKVEGLFARKQKVTVHDVDFRGNSISSASPYYFHNCIYVSEIYDMVVRDCEFFGNINVTLAPGGQTATNAICSTGNAGHHIVEGCNFETFYRCYYANSGVEGFRVDNCAMVNVVYGIVTDNVGGEPGGWISNTHINCIAGGIWLLNKNAYYITNVDIYRSAAYYEVADWFGILLDTCTSGAIVSARFVPQPITTGIMRCIKYQSCDRLTADHIYLTGGHGITSGGSNTLARFDDVIFHSLTGTTFEFDATDLDITLGPHEFRAMSPGYGTASASYRNKIVGRNNRHGNGVSAETTVSAAGTGNVIPHNNYQVLRYFGNTGAGSYTYAIELRTDQGAKNGDGIVLLLRFAASTNPNFSVKNGTGGSTIMTFANAGGTARTVRAEFAFDGTNWVCIDAGVVTAP